MSAHQPSGSPITSIDLNIVLSDVTEEDTDLEDGHISPVNLFHWSLVLLDYHEN